MEAELKRDLDPNRDPRIRLTEKVSALSGNQNHSNKDSNRVAEEIEINPVVKVMNSVDQNQDFRSEFGIMVRYDPPCSPSDEDLRAEPFDDHLPPGDELLPDS